MSDHWKSLADLLGAPSLSSTPKSSEPIANKPAPAESTPAPQPVEESVAPEEPVAVEPAPVPEPVKPKKRSSWETLASLFNIGSQPQPEPPAPVAPPPPPAPVASKPVPPAAAVPPSQPTPELSLFKPSAAVDKNPALTEMFGEASAKPHESWGKPRRMVNDVDWDDEDSPRRADRDPVDPRSKRNVETTATFGEVDSDDAESDDVDDVGDVESSGEEPLRRSRRRRRRGRGGRGGDEARGAAMKFEVLKVAVPRYAARNASLDVQLRAAKSVIRRVVRDLLSRFPVGASLSVMTRKMI